jgi:hypothetical protein
MKVTTMSIPTVLLYNAYTVVNTVPFYYKTHRSTTLGLHVISALTHPFNNSTATRQLTEQTKLQTEIQTKQQMEQQTEVQMKGQTKLQSNYYKRNDKQNKNGTTNGITNA